MESYLKNHDLYCCSGCGACREICPRHCIELQKGEDGFYYPAIDPSECVSCHLCERVCPYETPAAMHFPLSAYAAVAADPDVVRESSSGGIFRLAAENVLKDHGVVCGAAMDGEFRCRHIVIQDINELYRLQKSKYIQSVAAPVYPVLKKCLKNGEKVLFSGTPCQVAGFKNYLGTEYDNLYTVDIACHGVPSQADFDAYVRYLEKKHGGKLRAFDFRDKTAGKRAHYLSYEMDINGRIRRFKRHPYRSAYYYSFLHGGNFRKSCYCCPYAKEERTGDVTLADCWGIYAVKPSFSVSHGVSTVTGNTEKGISLLKTLLPEISYCEIDREIVIKDNQPFLAPCKEPDCRDELVGSVIRHGYTDGRRYMSRRRYMTEMIKAAIPDYLKDRLKAITARRRK